MRLDCLDVMPVASSCADVEPIAGADLDRLFRSHLNRGASDHMRSVDLRVLLARLPDETVASVGEMLSIKPTRLKSFLRGEAYLNKTQAGRVELLLSVVRVVSEVLESAAITPWLDANLPALDSSARNLLKRGRGADLSEHVGGYLNTNYS